MEKRKPVERTLCVKVQTFGVWIEIRAKLQRECARGRAPSTALMNKARLWGLVGLA